MSMTEGVNQYEGIGPCEGPTDPREFVEFQADLSGVSTWTEVDGTRGGPSELPFGNLPLDTPFPDLGVGRAADSFFRSVGRKH